MTGGDVLATDHRYSRLVRKIDATIPTGGQDADHREFEAPCDSGEYLVGDSVVSVQGHYNHFDDPDEFWDEEPLEIRRPPGSGAAASTPQSPVEFLAQSRPGRSSVEALADGPFGARPGRGAAAEPDRGGSVEDVDLQQEQFERLRVIAQHRIEAVMAEVRAQPFTGTSADRTATARVSSSGVVLDIQLSNGFGDPRQPAWVIADGINATARAIVEAVNAARTAAADAVAGRFSDEFRHK